MIHKEKLAEIIEAYKDTVASTLPEKVYKWEAVAWFQEYWNLESEEFSIMFEKATERASSLLTSGYFYPRKKILDYRREESDMVCGMFIDLLTKEQDIAEGGERFS